MQICVQYKFSFKMFDFISFYSEKNDLFAQF